MLIDDEAEEDNDEAEEGNEEDASEGLDELDGNAEEDVEDAVDGEEEADEPDDGAHFVLFTQLWLILMFLPVDNDV